MNTRRGENSGTEPLLLPATGLTPSLRRIGALIERYVFLLRGSGVRVIELIYWPFLQMLTWGFLQKYLAEYYYATRTYGRRTHRLDVALGHPVLLKDRLLHDLRRGDMGTQSWQLLTSPLRLYEFVAALSVWSVIRLGVSTVPVAFAAYFIFGFNLLGLGPRARRLLCRACAYELVTRPHLRRLYVAIWACRRRPRLVPCFPPPADSAAFFIQCRFCRRGFSRLRWHCLPRMFSKVCAQSCFITPLIPRRFGGRWVSTSCIFLWATRLSVGFWRAPEPTAHCFNWVSSMPSSSRG